MIVEWIEDEGQAPRPTWVSADSRHPVHGLLSSESAELVRYYDRQHATWASWVRAQDQYFESVYRGIKAASPLALSRVLEFASGSVPLDSQLLGTTNVVRSDASVEMLAMAPKTQVRVGAMASALPFQNHVFDMAVGVNPVFDVGELVRVVRESGIILVSYSFGTHTPVYRSPETVAAELPERGRFLAGRGRWGEYHIFDQR